MAVVSSGPVVIVTVTPPGTAVPTLTVGGTATPLVPGQTGTMGEYSLDLTGIATEGDELPLTCVLSGALQIPFFFEGATEVTLEASITFTAAGAPLCPFRLCEF